jgi:hypothetical protein
MRDESKADIKGRENIIEELKKEILEKNQKV